MARLGRAYPISLATKRRRRLQPLFVSDGGSGGNNTENFNTTISTSWNHNVGGQGGCLLVGFTTNVGAGVTQNVVTTTVTYGGVAMTSLGRIVINDIIWTELWIMLNPPPGTNTVAVTASGGPATGRQIAGNSVHYNYVASYRAMTTASNGFTNAISQSSVSAPGEVMVNVMGSQASITGYNQTARVTTTAGLSPNDVVRLGEAPGSNSSTTFSGTSGQAVWASGVVRLVPRAA